MPFLRNFNMRDAQLKFLKAGFTKMGVLTRGKFPYSIETFTQQVWEKIGEHEYVFDIIFDNEMDRDFNPRALNLEIEDFTDSFVNDKQILAI